MENDNVKENVDLERMYIQQRVSGMNKRLEWFNNAVEILKKYHFTEKFPIIISLLRKSNEDLWEQVDHETEESRLLKNDMSKEKHNALVETWTKKIAELEGLEEDENHRNELQILKLKNNLTDLEDRYHEETQAEYFLTDLNYNYTDIELIEFFVEHAENLDMLIQYTNDPECSFTSEDLFAIYFANLFAHSINHCEIKIEEDEIKITPCTIDTFLNNNTEKNKNQ
jgi:hypothetical protein